jgi:MFS family permease
LCFAPTIAWLFAGRLIAGIFGASFTTAGAYIADVSTPDKRAQNFGLIGAAFGLGFIIGPVLVACSDKLMCGFLSLLQPDLHSSTGCMVFLFYRNLSAKIIGESSTGNARTRSVH